MQIHFARLAEFVLDKHYTLKFPGDVMDDDSLSNFTVITSSTADKARQYLSLTDGNLEQALELYFTNDGADLEPASNANHTSSSQAPSVPSSSTRSARRDRAYEDNEGVVHVDSDEDLEASDEDTTHRNTNFRAGSRTVADAAHRPRTPATATPPTAHTQVAEDDEAMARRLQEELYGASGMGDVVDSEGIRAPIARTTETLVGPGAYNLDDEDDMHAAVLEQMRARRQPRSRGTVF